MRRYSFFIFSFVFIPSILLSQGKSSAFSELQVPTLASVAALGSSNVASPVFGINPASLSKNESMNLLFSSNRWFGNLTTYSFSLLTPTKYAALAFSIRSSHIPDIEIRHTPGDAEGIFTYRFSVVQFSAATSLSNNVSLGITGKYIYSKLYVYNYNGYSFDAGLRYETDTTLSLAIAVTDIGSIDGQRQTNTLPTRWFLGCSYILTYDDFTPSIFASISNDNSLINNRLHFGIEVNYNNDLSARIGYVTGYGSHSFSYGLGVTYSLFQLDYAYIPMTSHLENSHTVTLNIRLD